MRTIPLWLIAALLAAAPAAAQTTGETTENPFPRPIVADEDVIRVEVVDFASVPDVDGSPPRTMLLVDEPGSGRMFVNDMRGPLYSVDYDGETVTEYLDIDDPEWGVEVESSGRERGFQSFAFHPEFARPGSPGFGRFYTWTDSRNTTPEPDFRPGGGQESHHTVLLEWTANDPHAPTYDGGPPRELARFEQPYGNHNGGHLDQIYAYGMRNPQRFGWDPATGAMFVADIGQSIVEELSPAAAGTNLGWSDWEGSFRFVGRSEVRLDDRRGDPHVTYPVAEYGHRDPLLLPRAAVTGVHVYREGPIEQLRDLVLFGDMPSGEIFYVDADDLPDGGQDAIRRVLLRHDGETRTLRELVREKNAEQGRNPAGRVDLRFGTGPDERVFLLNKHDGTIRLLVPDDGASP